MPAVQTVVLFTDLVGSTELAAGIDTSDADALRSTYFSLLRKAVATHGGTEVKNLGDGLMVAFPSPSGALACAVAMQQNIDAHNRSARHRLAVRIGLSAGEATLDEGDYFGDPVVEAARLCARAEGGQILAADLVRANAGRRAVQTFVPVGELELKGLPGAVPTVEVAWAPLPGPAAGVPLPVRLQSGPATGFFGRQREVAGLDSAFKAVTAGDGRRVVLLAGEPGMGKTTLAVEVARAVHRNGGLVLYGRCDEELGLPYQPFAEALEHYVAHSPEDVLAAHVADHGGELAGLVPAFARRLAEQLPPARSSDSETQRYLLFGAVIGLLASASADDPVLLVLDDLHWADRATLLLFRSLVGAALPMRTLILGTYRASELSSGHPLAETLAALRRHEHVERVSLAGWDDGDVVALMTSEAGRDLDGGAVELAHRLRAETDGNPFFLLEILRHLDEGGGFSLSDGGAPPTEVPLGRIAIPQSVREVVGQRVARLGRSTEQLLSTAAVIGREFDVDFLAELSGLAEDDLLDILDGASAAALVTVVPGSTARYSFAHAVIQHTLYDIQSPARRQLTHRHVAELLERLYGTGPGPRAGELASHWLAAGGGDSLTRAFDSARWAGEAALASFAPEEAVRWFSRALDLADRQAGLDPHLRVDVLIGLGDAQRQVGDAGHRSTLLEAADEALNLNDPARLVRAALVNTRGVFSQAGAVDAERVAVLEAALAATDGDSPERARLLATLALELTFAGDWAHRRALADEAVAMARRLGDPDTVMRVRNLLGLAVDVPETLEERLATTAEVVGMADAQADPGIRHWAHRYRLYACAQSADIEAVDRHLEATVSAAAETGDPHLVWSGLFIRAWRSLNAGHLDDAERLATEAFQIGTESGQPDAPEIYGIALLEIRRRQGRFTEMEEPLVGAVDGNPGLPSLRAVLARLYCDLGRDAEARRLVETEAASGFALPKDVLWLYCMAVHADVVARLGDADAAGHLYPLLAPWHRQIAFAYITDAGAVSLALGMLAATLRRYDEAQAHLTEAMVTHERLRAPFWVEQTRRALAAVPGPR
jgi:class 3 adenylate cyclase